MPAIVEIRKLSFAYPGGPAVLHEIDLVVESEETIVIVGPNGAGKSTLLLHLNGILPPRVGDSVRHSGVWIDGIPVSPTRKSEIRRAVGLVFQDPNDQLFCPTVGEDVRFGPRQVCSTEEEVHRRARRALDAVGLVGFEDRSPHELSVGQRKRACLAGVLACEPKLLVMDEPTSHLDPRGRRELIELLGSISCPKIIATHDLDFTVELATRVVVMDGGRIHATGSPSEVLADAELMDRHGLEVPARLLVDPALDPNSPLRF